MDCQWTATEDRYACLFGLEPNTHKHSWSIFYIFLGHKFRPAYDFDYVALDLLSVYPEESGVYTCHARNAYGEAQTSATVKVSGKI